MSAELIALEFLIPALRKGRISALALEGLMKGIEQLGPLCEAYKNGDLDPADLAAILDKLKPVEYPLSADQKRAEKVMGKSFISPAAFVNAFRGRVRFTDEQLKMLENMPFIDEVLKGELELGEAVLFPTHPGVTLPMLRVLFGVDPESQPCIYNNDWWLGSQGDTFRENGLPVGWHLVRTKIVAGSTNKTWDAQAKMISSATHNRTLALEVALACFLVYRTQGGKRILEDMYAWCEDVGADGNRVSVGYFVRYGLHVDALDPSDDWDGHLGLLLSRK